MLVRRLTTVTLALAVLGTLAAASGSAEVSKQPGATAESWAIKVVVPGAAGGSTAVAQSPPAGATETTAAFAYPRDGSVILTGDTSASASTAIGSLASANAASSADDVSIFDGEITADSVAAGADAATGQSSATGSFGGTGVVNLQVLGQKKKHGRVDLGDWGYLTVGAHGIDTSAPTGAFGFNGFVTGLDVHLNQAHGGLPAGSEIVVGYAETQVQTAPKAPTPLPLAPGEPLVSGPMPGDRPQLLPKVTGPLVGVPQVITPAIDGGPYVFPVYGRVSYVDTFGAFRPDVPGNYHHGDDIFGRLGQPLVAVANGTVFSVGWNTVGGNRLWLRDRQGNEFYYAHLAAFSTTAVDGARVKAGEVIGFMGDTGDAEGTPVHLHFEVHPVSLLYLGYNGAVDPTTYLESWKRLTTLPYPVAPGWAPTAPGSKITAPTPGAELLGVSDISSGDGLDPASVLRALKPKSG
jgi:murein DD-endopeptidase MepM/ murein hydrolase activator NlpD